MFGSLKRSLHAISVAAVAICSILNISPAYAQAGVKIIDTLVDSTDLAGSNSAIFRGGTLQALAPDTQPIVTIDAIYPFTVETSGTFNSNGKDFRILGNINGAGLGGLTIVGAGSVTFGGSNSYSGVTNFSSGTLFAGQASALGTGTLAFTGGTLGYSGGNTQDYSNRFSTAALENRYNINTGGNNVTFGTTLSSSGASLTKIGSGTLTLSPTGTNSFSGGINLFGGNLRLGNADAIGLNTKCLSEETLNRMSHL